MTDPRRALPSVNALLSAELAQPFLARAPRALVANAVRAAIEDARRDPAHAPRDDRAWEAAIGAALAARERRSLRPVFNATGVVLHTNLGRAPLPHAALEAIAEAAQGYSNLEYDLERGTRGSRYTHCVSLLTELSGAEDALVVNNGASAMVLALNTLAEGRDAIVSRGELVEIGGSFRIPDIMAKSGARLVEIGTTNRTHLDDYARALSPNTGAVVKVHRSNFTIEGFVADVPVPRLAELCAGRGTPILHDLGSGLFISLESCGLSGEPVAAQAVRDGATVVTMSGDKLLGGPQAGIVLGTREAVGRMRKNPLTRALRVDKLTLAALEATLALYRDPAHAMREIPTLAMLSTPLERIRERAAGLAAALTRAGHPCEVVPSEGSVGGGAFPTARVPSAAVAIAGDPEALDARCRSAIPPAHPVVGRIADGRFLLDLRSVPEDDNERFTAAVLAALA
jgi:L-seryl-tRNA(Ser) seleniumtransferase